MSRRSRGLTLLALILCCMTLSASAAVVAWGSRGAQVTLIQQKLKQYGYFDGTVDGVFGRDTYNAVVWFQKKNSLNADGAVGPSTAAALGVSLSGGTVAVSGERNSRAGASGERRGSGRAVYWTSRRGRGGTQSRQKLRLSQYHQRRGVPDGRL